MTEGRRVRDVAALPPRDVLLVLEDPDDAGGPVRRLRLSALPNHARVHLQIGRTHRHGGATDPFFQTLAERLEGSLLTGLAQVGADRVLRLELRGADGREHALVGELFGRGANLVLLDGEGGVVGSLVRPRPGSPAEARLAPGAAYAPPGGGREPLAAEAPLVQALPDPPPPELPHLEGLARLAPLSWRVEAALGQAADEEHASSGRRALATRVRRRLKSARDRLRGLEERERACAEAERVRMDGELVLSQLSVLSRGARGAREVRVADWFVEGQPERTIALDPRLGAKENAERFFARARKLRRSAETLPAEIGRARAGEEALAAFLARIEEGEEPPEELEAHALAEGLLPPAQSAPDRGREKRVAPRLPYRRFTASRGSEVRVGRSAADNDRLTFREARGNDVWLHTSDAPGSHVVLRLEGRGEPDPEELLDAAHLAVHFSPLRGARRADVHVARCKQVKKPRGAPAGLVQLSGGRTLSVRAEPERLAALLRGTPRGGGS